MAAFSPHGNQLEQATILDQLQTQGFVIVPSLIPAPRLPVLQAAARELTTLGRSGQWPTVRTVGKQFPPWPVSRAGVAPAEGIWGVQGLMNPIIPCGAAKPGEEEAEEEEKPRPNPYVDTFASIYFSSAVLDIVTQLLSCSEDELVMELLNMLVDPPRDFALRWHRDDIPASAAADEELERLGVACEGTKASLKKKRPVHAQYNLALTNDSSLVVVPGSHVRARTAVERDADPLADSLPDMLMVQLKPGDAVFYDNNILHRGVYKAGKERMTVHGSVGYVGGRAERARNVLQHGVGEWAATCGFEGLEDFERGDIAPEGEKGGRKRKSRREVAMGMRDRLIAMAGSVKGDVGFSLEG